MICYRDRSFCSRLNCSNTTCHRYLTADHKRYAEEEGLPIAMSDFYDEEHCASVIEGDSSLDD